jgi:hypothetical protein
MFLRTKKAPERVVNTASVNFPNGAVVETTNGFFYYMKNDVKIPITDPAILASWRVVNVPLFLDEALKHKVTSGALKLRDGTVVSYGGKNWYASESRLRPIEDIRWYLWLNINDNDIIEISKEVFDLHKTGEPLN